MEIKTVVDLHRLKNELIDVNLKLLVEANGRFFKFHIQGLNYKYFRFRDDIVKFMVDADLADLEYSKQERLDVTEFGMEVHLTGGSLKHINGGVDNIDTYAIDNPVLDQEHIHNRWRKAVERLNADIEGAITSARTLIETVLKHILDERSVKYNPKEELPKLYKVVSNELSLAPSETEDESFKQILTGTISIIKGCGSLRSKIGDAHGSRKVDAKAEHRHAEFMVNVAGSASIFLLRTHIETLR